MLLPVGVARTFCRALSRDERGNIAILFAASVIPLLLLMGGVVDVARFSRYKADLSNAVDAAALALARQGKDYTESQATTFVQNYVAGLQVGDDQFNLQGFTVDKTSNGYIVAATGAMKTIFLPLGKLADHGSPIMNMGMNIAAEVVHSSNRVELALVVDNTASMSQNAGSNPCNSTQTRLAGLKCASTLLVNELMSGEEGETSAIKIGIVPFNGIVNTGVNTTSPPAWVEWSDQAQANYSGRNFNKYNFSTSSACSQGSTSSSCKYVGPKWLFGKLNIAWAGCVEMRAEPYDILDTAPDSATPNTLFVPAFWPDEPDSNNDDGNSYGNNYLNDKGTFTTGGGWNPSEDPVAAQLSLPKYISSPQWQSGKKDTTYPYDSGPNKSCPRPLVPLTTNKTTLLNAINQLDAHGGMGTSIPTGLVWGWHMLSSHEPLTEGLAPGHEDFNKTIKALILLTDGDNSVPTRSNHNYSDYTGYNYLQIFGGVKRLGSTNGSTAESNLNTKTANLCTNVKNAGVRLYTITFGSMSSSTENLMRNCATLDDGERLYYHAPGSSELESIFHEIGEDLSEIHLSM